MTHKNFYRVHAVLFCASAIVAQAGVVITGVSV